MVAIVVIVGCMVVAVVVVVVIVVPVVMVGMVIIILIHTIRRILQRKLLIQVRSPICESILVKIIRVSVEVFIDRCWQLSEFSRIVCCFREFIISSSIIIPFSENQPVRMEHFHVTIDATMCCAALTDCDLDTEFYLIIRENLFFGVRFNFSAVDESTV